MKIGVTGSTGQLGRIVLEELKKRGAGDQVIALARSVEKAADLGLEAREFDYNNPETLSKSLKGIDRLLLISSSEVGKRAVQHRNVISAAKEAGVKWIIYTSLLRADQSSLSLAGEHLETEKLLKESGIAYTILRNGWYNENYAGSIPGALGAGSFLGSAGDGKISSAARADFAEAAATVLLDESHQGKVYELAGDRAYTLESLAEEISKQSGKQIPYTNLPAEEYAKILTQIGLPEGLALAIAGWDVSASIGDLFEDGKTLSQLIGRPTTPMAETVKDFIS